jgi:nitrite reductase/ring-hydroxylating ferredoxin subunit
MTSDTNGRARRPDLPGVPTYQELLDADSQAVPDVLRREAWVDLGDEPIDVERYLSQAWHDREMERMWSRVWQMACREEDIPDAGDSLVYDIGDTSLILVRGTDKTVRAFHNSCLHRGRQLRTEPGCVDALRCPFHGFTWGLDGELQSIPSPWDFEYLDRDGLCLPQARVDVWDGWVFVNLDDDAAPLAEYLGEIVDHFEEWPMVERAKVLHIVKHLRCNWKVGLEAFLESYHVIATHPQLLINLGDVNTEYALYDGQPHFNRMMAPQAVPSPHLGPGIEEQAVVESLIGDRGAIEDGRSARAIVGDVVRGGLAEQTGEEILCSDAEAIDGIQYFVFPNFVPWGGYAPIVYRFRPNGNDPATSVMEVILLQPVGSGPRPAAALPQELDYDEPFSSIRSLGRLAEIFDQDMSNIEPLQRGLQASKTRRVNLSSYQESRIRHYLVTLDRYLADPPPSPSTNGRNGTNEAEVTVRSGAVR